MLEVGALAESKDGTRCIVLESKEVLRGEAEVTGIRLTQGMRDRSSHPGPS